MRALIALSLAVAGCASTAPAPPASPPSTSTPEAAAASSTPSSPPAAAGECFAAIARARPEGWIDTGKIIVTLADGKPTAIEIRDATGKAGPPVPLVTTSPEASRENLRTTICLAGGVLGVLPGKPPKSGTVTLDVIRPSKEDVAGDLAILCSEPKGLTSDLDDSQKVVIARQIYGEQLTSVRYRGWLHHLGLLRGASDADKARQFEILAADAKAAGKSGCWFADVRRQ
jgi:hypothetical protein